MIDKRIKGSSRIPLKIWPFIMIQWSEPRLNRTGNSAYFEPFLPYT